MEIAEVLDETTRAMKVSVMHEGEKYIFWVPKAAVIDFDINDRVALDKIYDIINGYTDPEELPE